MPNDSIFLSGWEYNRVLADSPLETRASALPAQCLWNGSAQFWLFKSVYCLQEALDNEIDCYEALGWTTGYIFKDLARREFLTAKKMSVLKGPSAQVSEALSVAHSSLKSVYPREKILSLIENGEEDEH